MHGIVVRDLDNTVVATQSLRFEHMNRELIFNHFDKSTTNLYWQLPYQFLGNKITSYGGHLNYTFRFQGNFLKSDHNVAYAIITGKNTTLLHQFKGTLQPLLVNTISISLTE